MAESTILTRITAAIVAAGEIPDVVFTTVPDPDLPRTYAVRTADGSDYVVRLEIDPDDDLAIGGDFVFWPPVRSDLTSFVFRRLDGGPV